MNTISTTTGSTAEVQRPDFMSMDSMLDKQTAWAAYCGCCGDQKVSEVATKLKDTNALGLGTVTAGGKLSLDTNGALDLGTSTVGGNLSANSNGGDITQGGALTVAGTSTLAAGAGDITLNNAGNSFFGVTSFSGQDVSVAAAGALTATVAAPR